MRIMRFSNMEFICDLSKNSSGGMVGVKVLLQKVYKRMREQLEKLNIVHPFQVFCCKSKKKWSDSWWEERIQ